MKLKEFSSVKFPFKKKIQRKISDLRYQIRSFKTGIKNLITWSKIIWQDRQFDYHYMQTILGFKLKLMQEYMENANFLIPEEYQKINSKLRIAVKLLDKISTSFYELEHYDYIKSEMDFVEIEDDQREEKMYRMEVEYQNDRLDEYFKKYKRRFDKLKGDFDLTKSDTRMSLASKIADKNHQRARTIFYTLINRYEEGWWD